MVAALLGLLVPGVAQAAPPPNDDFGQATPIGALPFTTTQAVVEATHAADDPDNCYAYQLSVWFTYTAPATGVITATTAGSTYDTALSAHTGSRGALTRLACNDDVDGTLQSRIELPVVAGARYHFMISSSTSRPAWPPSLTFSVTGPATLPNDAFADAEPVTLPHTAQPTLSTATLEPDEPAGTCEAPTRSLWYAVTLPETTPVTFSQEPSTAVLSVFTGSSPGGLTEVDCASSSRSLTFRAVAGTTYYLRVAQGEYNAGNLRFTIDVAQPIVPYFAHDPASPSAFDDVRFYDYTEVPDVSTYLDIRWDFGDGTTAEGREPQHRYAADGDYTVTLTHTTGDGRSATTSRVVQVRTHDVAIARFTTPAAATVGVTKPVTIRIANTRYAEDVTVTLYRSTPSGWSEVGHYTQYVPASATGTVGFPFSYTFRPDDAALGKVNFRAVASLPDGDDHPLDNEAISATTAVRPALTGLDLT